MIHDFAAGGDSTPEDEAKAQPKPSPLPTRAYSKLSDIDPLSPLEEEATYSDDEFFTMVETGPLKVPEEKAHENTRFYGKSSVLVLTSQAFNEKRRGAGARDIPDHRKQFWTTPDVSPVIVREHSITKSPSSGCPPCSNPLPYTSSTLTWTLCDTLWTATSIISTSSFLFSTALPSCVR